LAKSKTYLFSKEDVELARVAKVLSHPARVEILKILSKQTECICGEIVKGLPLAQATVSQHLKELKMAGIISGTIEGPKSCYCIDWKKLESISKTLSQFLLEIKDNHKRCC